MDEQEKAGTKRGGILMVILAGIVTLILCGICITSGIILRENLAPQNRATRTALVELFGTPIPHTATEDTLGLITSTPTVRGIPSGTFTSSPTQTPASPTPTFSPPVWTEPPQGVIVFTCIEEGIEQVCAMNADGSHLTQLTQGSAPSFSPAVSAIGGKIIFVSYQNNNYNLFMMNLDGSGLEQLTEGMGNLFSPEISPNNNRVVFTIRNSGREELWIMKIDGTNARPLSSDPLPGSEPAWAPDSSRIAFTSSKDGSPQLYIIQANGNNLRQVTKGIAGINGGADWAPGGERLVFTAKTSSGNEIFTIGTTGKDQRQLTEEGENRMPAYSPDGQWIVFVSERSGTPDLYVMRADGSQVTRITGDVGVESNPDWGPGKIQ